MQIPNEKVLELLRERGRHDQADQADDEQRRAVPAYAVSFWVALR